MSNVCSVDWLLYTRNRYSTRVSLCAALENESIQQQQDHGANDRHDPTRDVIFSGKDATDPRADERAGNAEQNRNDAATGVFSWHQQFRNGADNKADHQNPKNRMSAKVHNEPSSIDFISSTQENWFGVATRLRRVADCALARNGPQGP